MSESEIGKITWQDLTVPNADAIRDFYSAVVGWTAEAVDMGGYSDYSMMAPDGSCGGGICNARGANAEIPPQWLVYITVQSVAKSVEKCIEMGGKVLSGPRDLGNDTFCVIQDPAGAVCALYQKG
jgi:predicted enzyme related to lactoylglutathione lyase